MSKDWNSVAEKQFVELQKKAPEISKDWADLYHLTHDAS